LFFIEEVSFIEVFSEGAEAFLRVYLLVVGCLHWNMVLPHYLFSKERTVKKNKRQKD